MVSEAEEFAEQDKKVKARIDARNQLETYCYNMKQVRARVGWKKAFQGQCQTVWACVCGAVKQGAVCVQARGRWALGVGCLEPGSLGAHVQRRRRWTGKRPWKVGCQTVWVCACRGGAGRPASRVCVHAVVWDKGGLPARRAACHEAWCMESRRQPATSWLQGPCAHVACSAPSSYPPTPTRPLLFAVGHRQAQGEARCGGQGEGGEGGAGGAGLDG